jgi:hypothetical protein
VPTEPKPQPTFNGNESRSIFGESVGAAMVIAVVPIAIPADHTNRLDPTLQFPAP